MCLFPLPNNDLNSIAYKKGVREFSCGACPECLSKRANSVALQAVYEAKSHLYNCMVTLTYDTFIRDEKGKILGENPVNSDLLVDKRHIQLFMKRLRKWYSFVAPGEKIKYLCGAEYGSRTHRAHYHLILFGVRFPDLHFYKRSKRGNPIYMSDILTRLWGRGICTVDSINVHTGVARYCTKYCAKQRSDETFMLRSQRLGLEKLIEDFNGKSYIIDGREYPIPRSVWQSYITNKYSNLGFKFDYRYVNRDSSIEFECYDLKYLRGKLLNSVYRAIRDSDSVYSEYLSYWQWKSERFDMVRLPVGERIFQLSEDKWHFYKIRALKTLSMREHVCASFPAPGSKCISAYEHFLSERHFRFLRYMKRFKPSLVTCPISSRPYRASDTVKFVLSNIAYRRIVKGFSIYYKKHRLTREFCTKSPKFLKQLNFFS